MSHRLAGALVVSLFISAMAGLAIARPSFPSGVIASFWQRDVTNNMPPKAGSSGLVLSDVIRTSDDRSIMLGAVDGKPSLFVDPDTAGPGKIISLPIHGDRLRIAEVKDGGFWIGGSKNDHFEGVGSSEVSEAYLVKLDRDGGMVWERSFGSSTQRTIESLAPLPSGGVIVSGRAQWTNWLAKISPLGQIEWERSIGVGHGTSVSVAHDTVFLAGLDAGHEAGDGYQEDIVLWSLDVAAGRVLDRRIVRDRVATIKNSFLGRIQVRSAADAIFVFSSGLSSGLDVPIEVAKLAYDVQTYWRTTLVDTVQTRSGGGTFSCSTPGITLLENGDPLIACAISDQVIIFGIGSSVGDTRQASLLLPPCHHDSAAAIFLIPKTPHSVRILGTRPENVFKASCTWLAEIPVAN